MLQDIQSCLQSRLCASAPSWVLGTPAKHWSPSQGIWRGYWSPGDRKWCSKWGYGFARRVPECCSRWCQRDRRPAIQSCWVIVWRWGSTRFRSWPWGRVPFLALRKSRKSIEAKDGYSRGSLVFCCDERAYFWWGCRTHCSEISRHGPKRALYRSQDRRSLDSRIRLG